MIRKKGSESMEIKIIDESQFSTSVWSGGKTTEMYLYPQDASYKERNFLFRISSATVEDETSVFTRLPGIHREILLLNGSMVLQHGKGVPVTLQPYEPHAFEGEWETVSHGKATDFNVMYQNCKSFVKVISETGKAVFEKTVGMDFFYSKEDDFRLEQTIVKRGQLAMITGQPGVVKLISDEENPGIIHVGITDLPGPAERVE